MKNIVVLGSTGSIGTQTLDVCRMHGFGIKALSAGRNTGLLEKQAREFQPEYVCIFSEDAYSDMKQRLSDTNIKVLCGMEGLCSLAGLKCDIVVNSVVGMVGLVPTLEAAKAGNDIALANKETLVAGGRLVTDCVKSNNVRLLPIDSEHSAIFQCLMGAGSNRPEKILLTASGGPFYGWTRDELSDVTVEQALRHPNWSMGAKITIDSATLMNKGLELIEAVRLFDVKPEQVEIVVHRQSIIHSAVEFADGAVIAQLGTADMRIPIQLALTYPERLTSPAKRLSLSDVGELTFGRADEDTFICLAAAKKAIAMEGNAPCIVNSANEAAVALFLQRKIGFNDIGEAVCGALGSVKFIPEPTLQDILDTRTAAEEYVAQRFGG
ncbi:MAG: 1-deoxy-D-xylulose-5-phosphate reductoisomerase [Oscillospiraceae bacterium]|nr:1-deoxy-D-xylulose-5-phosphate reductoisomerase [Oscillospiraceae bacterium]MDY4588354.1 1-deoxy-D-xylulose-5-phosphate reductoisomerase [Oscillospiraceae bacterium]